MAGTQTAGFDLVMQFSEDAYHELLGALFDTDGLIARIAGLIPGAPGGNDFTLAVSLDRPGDVALSPGATNPLDIRLGLGSGGQAAGLRMVVGITVNRSAPAMDVVTIDFAHAIYFAEAKLLGVTVPLPNLKQALASVIPSLPVLPVPVDRASDDPTRVIRADFKLIDDPTPADADATAAMLTFGGGERGNDATLASFVPAGERGAIGVYFKWLCRMAVGPMGKALGLPDGSFDLSNDRCALNRTVRVDQDEEVDLTSLVLSLEDGYIGIKARVTKSGFCYDAAGEVSARLLLAIDGGRLKASVEVGDPDVDVDVPWYCYVVGAAIGAVIGGVLVGVIGAIIGAVLVPLILWIAADVVEGTIQDAAERIADALNDVVPVVDLPAFGINILFQEVFVDDVVIQASLDVQERAPIRCQGTVRLAPGQAIDLDTGRVDDAAVQSGDVKWLGAGFGRRLETGCRALLARTGRQDFDGLARFDLYGLPYEPKASVGVWELGTLDALGILRGDPIDETRTVLAVRTNEGRYAVVQATQLELASWVQLRYRTYDSGRPTVAIYGGFVCPRPGRITADVAATFRPVLNSAGAVEQLSVKALAADRRKLAARVATSSLAAASPQGHIAAEVPVKGTRVFPVQAAYRGRWLVTVEGPAPAQAVLRAVTTGFGDGVTYRWAIGGTVIDDGGQGQLAVDSAQVGYAASGSTLTITVTGGAGLELFVQAVVADRAGLTAQAGRCLHREEKCVSEVRQVPSWSAARALHRLPVAAVASGMVGSSLTEIRSSARGGSLHRR